MKACASSAPIYRIDMRTYEIERGASTESSGVPWLAPLAFALKKLIANDEVFAAAVNDLNGKTILFHIEGLEILTFASFRHEEILLNSELPTHLETPHVTLRGRVKDFIALAKQQRSGQSVSAGQLEIQGELHTAQAVQDLFKNVDIDFEQIIASATNDAFAFGVASFARRTFSKLTQGVQALEKDFGEYIQYEKQLTPDASEMEEFSNGVDELAVAVERLELRIEKFSRTREIK